MYRWRKPLLITLALAVTALVLVLLAHQFVLRQLQAAVLQNLGPRASIGELTLDSTGIELHDLRVRAERGGANAWPAEDELRARRLRLVPQWSSLWSRGNGPWRIARVDAEGLYVSVLRTRQGMRMLPALLERPRPAGAAPPPERRGGLVGTAQARSVEAAPAASSGMPMSAGAGADAPTLSFLIDKLHIEDTAVDFFDATVARPAHRLQLAALRAELGSLAWPEMDRVVPVSLQARLKARPGSAEGRDGELRIDGELTPATRDARLKIGLKGVDLRVLQPYLLKVNEAGIERGLVDLTLDATVKAQRLRAPGTVVFSELQMRRGGGLLDSFAGVPRQVVLAAMQRQGRIELKFTLEGRLDDPAFSLNEDLATRLAFSLAEVLGVSVGGVVEGLGGVIKGLFGR